MLHAHGLTLYDQADLSGEAAFPHAADIREIAAWAREFLGAPNQDLGRRGAVCPFAKPSMDSNSFLLGCAGDDGDLRSIETTVEKYRRWFIELQEQPGRMHKHLLAIVLVLPGLDRVDSDPLNALQARLKDAFVGEGMMIGQFHPHCEQGGLWSANFRPLKAPAPLLAIRQMVASDLPFLIGSANHLTAYLDRFAPGIPGHIRRLLVARVTNAADQDAVAA